MPSPSRATTAVRLFEILQRSRGVLLGVGIVLLILGAKLWLIDVAGSSLPILDQIDGEGEVILRPWLEGRLGWGNFWHPHNEHRIVLTKLVALGLVAFNGQWDAYVEMLVGGLMHALLVPVLLAWMRPQVRGIAFAVLALALTAMWMLPINWENTLQGFQTQFYFVLWLGFLQCRGVLGSDRLSWSWGAGNLCGLLALGAMASGSLCSVAIIAVVSLEVIRERRITRLQIATLGLSLLWIVLGWWWRNPVPGHAVLKAHSLGEFVTQFWHMAVWPYAAIGPALGVLALLVPYRVVQLLRQPTREASDRVFVGLAGWVFAIIAATAFYRANGVVLSSRYVDQLYIGIALQGLVCASVPVARWRYGLLAGWMVVLGLALANETGAVWRETLAGRGALMAKQEAHVRAFLANGDPRELTDAPPAEVPHPQAAVLVERWSYASIQSIMPASVRRPVPLQPLADADLGDLPAPTYPIIAQSSEGNQQRPWRWQSETLPASTLPVLRFQFSGALGDPTAPLNLAIVSETGSVQIHPDSPSRARWKTINAIRPRGPWSIELEDADNLERIVLTSPVELGWLSWGTEKLIKHHGAIIAAGACLSLLAGGLLMRKTRPGATEALPPR